MSDKYPGGFVTAGAPAGFSVAFDGTTDYLTTSSGTSLGSGNFTIEAWVYLTAAAAGETTVGSSTDYYTAGFNGNFVFRVGTQNLWRSFDAQSNQATIDGTFTWATGQWYHMAWVRNSGTVTVYRNGTSLGSVADSKTLSDSTNGYAIAATKSGGSYSSLLTGYISNLRVVVGTALYTTTFTPPTQLLNISGTSLLTCNSPTIIDQSTNAYAITVSGDSKVSNFTPFAGYTGFNPALGAAAGGVWTLDEAAYYQQNRIWPIYDPYFNQTTLMLHGNGTNGAQNNTFLDSSASPLTITRNGNTTQGTFTPFSQTGWSNFFNGSSYLTVNNAATQLALGTVDWQIELWCYPTSLPGSGDNLLYDGRPGNGAYPMFSVRGVSAASPQKVIYYTNTAVQITSDGTVPIGAWTHVMVSRVSSVTRMFINGVVQSQTYADTTNYLNDSTHPQLGRNAVSNVEFWNGYMANVRVLKGSGTSTSFTPSTAPLTATTNTVLLTCQSNRLLDNSANNFSITDTGSGSIQAFSPFVPAYITPTTYSNWFDGTGDSLNLGGQAAFAFGTGDFTVENWIYISSGSGAERVVIDFRPNTTNGAYPMVMVTTGNILAYYVNTAIQITGTTTVALNTWHHIALARSGSSTKLFLNGIQEGSTYTDTVTYLVGTDRPIIGSSGFSGANYFFGTMSNLRVLKGTALYTANFTPPTAPLTNITNTSLLTCQSSTFIDNSTANGGVGFTITANGNVQPVTSPTPFPAKVDTTTLNSAYSTSLIGGSAYFDGTGDFLQLADSTSWDLTGDYTIEMWMYSTATPVSTTFLQLGSSSNYLVMYLASATKYITVAGSLAITASTALVLNTWNHIALVRNGAGTNNTVLYLNGVNVGQATNTTSFTGSASNGLRIGAEYPSDFYYNGYIAGNRIVNGTALYTSNFAPPVAPPTNITNTSLLANYTNGAIFDNTAKNVLETVGNAQISTTQSKYGGSSMYFDGTGDWLLIPNNQMLNLNSDFTIEFWIYLNSTSGEQCIFHNHNSDNNGIFVSVNGGGAGKIRLGAGNGSSFYVLIDSSTAISASTWNHVACTRSGSTWTVYINGSSAGTATSSSNPTFSTSDLIQIGRFTSGTPNALNAYLDDLRITRAARYTTSFTPPTSQLQDQ
jgi:hypothetical protein